MSWLLGDLAEKIGAECHGDTDCRISRVATLENAGKGDLAFLSNSRYRKYLKQTSASAVILSAEDEAACPAASLIHENPYLAFANAATLLYPAKKYNPGIASTAVIGGDVEIAGSASIGEFVVIGTGSKVGNNTVIEAGSVIGEHVQIGCDCHIYANVSLRDHIQVGNEVILHPGVVIGADGFGIANNNGEWVKIPQVGSVRIGDRVEIGANSTIDRGAIDDTVIADGVKIDNLVQVGHNVHIGENTAIAGCVGISGSTHIGKRCMIGGATGIGGHLHIVDDVIITGFSMVTKSVKTPGLHSSGIPLTENNKWRRNVARFQHLDEIYHRLRKLENED